MKRFYLTATLLVLTLVSNLSYAQYATYQDDSGWFFGLNIGSTYQRSDVNDRYGLGGGFTLGRNITPRTGRAISLDLRLRGLWGFMHGQDFRRDYNLGENSIFADSTLSYYPDSLGYNYNNYRTKMNEWSLELVFNMNRLRERTNILLYGYGGIGLTSYQTKTDMFDEIGNPYNYSLIDTIGTPEGIASNLQDFRDLDYETEAEGNEETKIRFMPSLGAGIGYQFTPTFSMAFEHKMTFSGIDLLDGIEGENPNRWYNNQDVYHYSGLRLIWRIGKGTVENNPDPDIDDYTVTNPPNGGGGNTGGGGSVTTPPPTGLPPVVNITTPPACPRTTSDNLFMIRAQVLNVNNRSGIQVILNGNPINNFMHDVSTNTVSANLILQPGSNVFEVRGTNNFGTDSRSCVVIYDSPVTNMPPPIVTITNPPFSPYTVQQNTYTVTATILNIDGPQNVNFMVNGINSNNFTYNVSTRQFTSTIVLNEGTNNIQITGTNAVGSDSKIAVIRYDKVQLTPPPVVTITNPPTSPYNSTQSTFNVAATILNVAGPQNVSFMVNGVNTQNFVYNAQTKQFSANINLVPGSNTIQITGTNQVGSDSKAATIIYEQINTLPPPIVNITNPPVTPYTVTGGSFNVSATILNIDGPQNVTFLVNGAASTNFSYSAATKQFNATIPLNPGSTNITIKGTNTVGSDTKSAVLIREQVTLPPPVVTFTTPNNGHVTSNPTITVTATVLNVNNQNDISLKINGVYSNNFTYNTVSKLVTITNANLNVGTNVFTLTGTNSVGSDTKSLNVIRREETGPPPVVTFTIPTNNPHTQTFAQAQVIAKVINVASQSDITVKVNGVVTNGFNYNTASKLANINTTLNQGTNTIEVTGTNQYGSDTETMTIFYNAPCPKPLVTFTEPTLNPQTLNKQQSGVVAKIENIASTGNFVYKINGTVSTNYTFNPTTGVFSSYTTLVEGPNTFTITATSDCGSDEKTMTIIYVPQVVTGPPPVVNITKPTANPHLQTTKDATLEATILNIDASNQITYKINGLVSTNFRYFPATKKFESGVTLRNGKNTLEITATNPWGSDTKTQVFNYKKPVEIGSPPVVTFTDPAPFPHTATVRQVTVKGTILNIDNRSQAVMKINGQTSTNFTYDAASKQFTISYTLPEGDTYFEMSATNRWGQDSKRVQLTYRPQLPAPDVSFTNPPTELMTVSNSSFTVTGQVQHISSKTDMTVRVNGLAISSFSYIPATKVFSIPILSLNAGMNSVEVTATNDIGSKTKSVTLNYNTSTNSGMGGTGGSGGGTTVNPPVITFTQPNINPFTSPMQNGMIKGKVTNITNPNNITMTLNGVSVNFGYSVPTTNFQVPVTLNNGTNVLVVTATNAGGSATNTQTLIWNQPPANNGGGNTGGNTGGGSSGGSSSGGTVSGGGNTGGGRTTGGGGGRVGGGKTTPTPVLKPIVKISTPSGSSATTTSASYTVKGSIKNVKNKSDITVKLNGSSKSFNWSSSGTFSSSLSLRPGKNTIVITAGKGTNRVSQTITVTRNQVRPNNNVRQPAGGTTTPRTGRGGRGG